jgi:hypothetical protein
LDLLVDFEVGLSLVCVFSVVGVAEAIAHIVDDALAIAVLAEVDVDLDVLG